MTLDLKSLLESITAQLGIGSELVAKLPESASSIEIMSSDELGAAQTGVNLLRAAAYVLTALTLLLYAAAIYLARDRRRETLRSVGISFVVIGVVVLFARKAAGNVVVSSLSGAATADDAVRATFDGRHLAAAGDGAVDRRLRDRRSCSPPGSPDRRATRPGHESISLRTCASRASAYGGLAVLLALVFWWDPVIATHRLVPSLLLIAFAAIGTEALRRQVAREFPDRVPATSAA